jgi:phosphatidate phosphatase APP1
MLALILIGLILPAFYITTSSLTGRTLPTPLREYQYSNTRESPVDISAIQGVLESLAQTMNPDDLNRLRGKLRGVVQFPVTESDPLGEYLRALSSFSDNMVKIDAKLQGARLSIASGNTRQATADLEQLRNLRDETESLLKSLTVLLDRLTVEYRIDTTTQQQKLNELSALFQTYSEQIDQLSAKLKTQQGFILTTLSLNTSKPEVFVDENILVYGFLKDQNGTAMPGRNVTISWDLNQTVLKQTDFKGNFEVNILFPIGFSAGLTKIEADFTPEGKDAEQYLPSTALLEVKVAYQHTMIVAEISPTAVRPLDYAAVKGNLSTAEGMPLEFRPIVIQVDGTFLGNATTNSTGWFGFTFLVPQTLKNGTHTVNVTFPASGERFAPSNITLPLIVEMLRTQTLIGVERTSLFSGMKLVLNGTVKYANGTAPTGRNVTIYLDNVAYVNATVRDDGSFISVIQLPIWLAFGSHSINATFVSDRPWIEGSESVVQVFIYNTPLIILAAVAVPTGSSLGIYLIRRSRRAVVLTPPTFPQPVVVERPAREEYSRERLISEIKAENVHAARIRKSYSLAQAIIDQKIGETSRSSETHWEYFSRVTNSLPNVKDTLKRLIDLFELAEYSPYPIENAHSREATEILLELREEVETVK